MFEELGDSFEKSSKLLPGTEGRMIDADKGGEHWYMISKSQVFTNKIYKNEFPLFC